MLRIYEEGLRMYGWDIGYGVMGILFELGVSAHFYADIFFRRWKYICTERSNCLFEAKVLTRTLHGISPYSGHYIELHIKHGLAR